MTIYELHRTTTVKALNKEGSIRKAAKAMGISAFTVFRWKKDFGIELINGTYKATK